MIISELVRVQEEEGWISPDAARSMASRLGVPLHRVEGVLSFYPHFRRTPPVRIEIAACRDMACSLRGGRALFQAAKALASADVIVREVSCLGRCDDAPAVFINGIPLHEATADKLVRIMRGEEPCPTADPLPPPRPFFLPSSDLAPPPPPQTVDPDKVIAALKEAGLRGLGGAGFPTADKWSLVRKATSTPKYVICNADESEPGTFKDRALLEGSPHLVLDGLALAAQVINAAKGIIYLRHEYDRALRALSKALAERHDLPCPVEIFVSPGGYILGEETALLEALEDRRGEPRNKPPFPGTSGLHGQPTLINNVETLAAAATIWRRGAPWWNAQGVRGSSGLKLVSVSGHVVRPGVYEIPMGTTVSELIGMAGGCTGKLLAFAPGGASSRFLPADKADTPIDFGSIQAAGSMLGSGALVVVAEGTDMHDLATNIVRFFRNESCGKCVPCRLGGERAVVILEEVAAGKRGRGDLALLDEIEEAMRLTSICGLGQVALQAALSIRDRFSSSP